ncbi:angiotensinogen isoform X2 [Pristis pectinata]|uniref:angiotensinogen isoform X2 n=1 Tax=Pristis pectinata TaxID=685728 RepID=UPI00223E8C7C|nr:angiotensinogen isoform X2 [Pristis pectinata]
MKLILSLLWIGTLLEPGATVRPYIHPFSMITCNISTPPAEVDGEDGFLPGLIGDNETQVNGSGEMWWEEEEEEEVKPDVRKRNYLSSLQASLGCAWLSHWTSREVSGVTMLFPMYLHVILAALSLGAQGSTADSLQEILGFSDNGCGGISGSQRSHDMRWHFRLLLRDILTHHRSSLSTGSWMVFQEGLRLRRTFARQLRHFHPEVRLGAVNFRQPQMAEESINNLIHRATAGRLDNLVTGLSPSTNLVVTSFVHFKGKWKTRSQCHGTELQDFFNDAGDKTQVLMMIWCGWLQYKTASNYTLIQLPMSETMYMILIQTVQPATMEEIMKMLPVDKTVKDFQTGLYIALFLKSRKMRKSKPLQKILQSATQPQQRLDLTSHLFSEFMMGHWTCCCFLEV